MMPGEKPKNFKKSFGMLLNYLGQFKIHIVIVMLFAAASTVFAIVGPKVLGQATTEMFNGIMGKISGTGSGIDFGKIGGILLTLLGLYLASAAFSVIQGWLMTGVSMKVTYRLRNSIMQKINRMPLGYFDRVNHGEVLSRVTNDVDTLSQTLNQSITQVITSVTTLVGILVMMFSISWELTLVALCILPVSMVFVSIIVKHSQKYFRAQQEYLGHVNGHVEEMYGGHVVMKAFNGEQSSVEKFDAYNNQLYNSAWKSQFLSGLMMPVMNFVGNVGYVAVCILGGWLAVNRGLPVGDIQAFVQYVRQFTQPITQIANISNILQQTMAAAERVFEFLDEKEEEPDAPTVYLADGAASRPGARVQVDGSVQFSHVHFGYTPEKIIIHDFSVDVKPGQKIAIVGPTGCGKTTLINLLMRFYDVDAGVIRMEGEDIRHITRDSLRENYGMVLQETWLKSATIAENIAYGNPDATREEIIYAAKEAHAHGFITRMPDGYDTVISEEGGNLSQGQKQLLCIARVMLRLPPVLILDEATSSIDTRTEIRVQQAFEKLMEGRTSFIVAHRLSTIRTADRILVMKDGNIIEQGTHEELLAKNGFYKQLYESQFA